MKSRQPGQLSFYKNNFDSNEEEDDDDNKDCSSLFLCFIWIPRQMIIAEIQISIQRSSSELLTNNDENDDDDDDNENLAGTRVEGEDRGRRSLFPPSGFSGNDQI